MSEQPTESVADVLARVSASLRTHRCWCGARAQCWVPADPQVTPDAVRQIAPESAGGWITWVAPRCDEHGVER